MKKSPIGKTMNKQARGIAKTRNPKATSNFGRRGLNGLAGQIRMRKMKGKG